MSTKIPNKLLVVEDRSLKKSVRTPLIGGKKSRLPGARVYDLIEVVTEMIEGAGDSGDPTTGTGERGPAGPAGEQGPVGPQGPQGEQGEQGEQGPAGVGIKGDKGDQGLQGDAGEGVPVGGTAGQVLAKASDGDLDTEWVDPAVANGVGEQVIGRTVRTENNGIYAIYDYDSNASSTGNIVFDYSTPGKVVIAVPEGRRITSLELYVPGSRAVYAQDGRNQAFVVEFVGAQGRPVPFRTPGVADGTNYDTLTGDTEAGLFMDVSAGGIPVKLQRVGANARYVFDRVGQLYSAGALITIS